MENEEQQSLGLIEALHSTPARRYLSDNPIDMEIVWEILDAAIRGPSGGNNQGWAWLVVKDQSVKDQISEWYREGWNQAYGVRRSKILEREDASDTLGPKNYLSAEHLANHIQEAPIWIFAIQRNTASSTSPRAGSSIYGAVQHLMLAARAHGIGSTLTTLYAGHEVEVKQLLGIPEDALTMALIPLGYPNRGRWSQPKRQAVDDVTHWGRWGRQTTR
jgi:nitroreductase